VETTETCQTVLLKSVVSLPIHGTASSPSARTVSSSGSSRTSQQRVPSGLASSGESFHAPKRSSRSSRPRGNSSRSTLREGLSKSRGASASTMQAEYHRIINSEAKIQVDLVDEGVGGTYFFKTTAKKAFKASSPAWKRLAIFKPGDEEPCAYNNPKGYSDEEDGEKGGIKPGEGWKREVLAYQLDHYNFANVPETIEVKLPNRLFARKDEQKGCKHGSLQKFVQSSDGGACKASCDVGPGPFPTDEVHRIGIFDIRLLNSDRHGGNILVQKDARGQVHLVPIDHSYILPKHGADLDFEWMFWPQSKEPFSAETLSYVAALDPDKDAEILRRYDIEEDCIELMYAATAILKIGCAQGLTLRTIAKFVRRERMYEPSGFEDVVGEARRSLEEGGEIDFCRLKQLLEERLGALYETPVPRSVPTRPVTFKEQVLSGVKAENISEGLCYLIKTYGEESIAVFKSSEFCKGPSQVCGKDLVSREVAAHRLDEDSWAGVPETIELRVPNKLFSIEAQPGSLPFTHGSVQRFIPGPVKPLCHYPIGELKVSDVHRLGILDIRLCNEDRRCQTMLVSENLDGSTTLHPTGHAGILPSTIGDVHFPWSTWPQAKVPFSQQEVHYVQQLDPDLDARILQDLEIGPQCIELQKVSTYVLKAAVELGFTLQQLGMLFERITLAQPSAIELLIAEVRVSLDEGGEVDFDLLRSVVSARLRHFLSNLHLQEGFGDVGTSEETCCCTCSSGSAIGRGRDSDSDLSCFSFESVDSEEVFF